MTQKSLTLILMRHAEAEDPKAGKSDSMRALTLNGRRQAFEAASLLKKINAVPQQIIVSPANRTQETLHNLVDAWECSPQITRDERLYKISHRQPPYDQEFDLVESFNEILEQADQTHDCVMVLGHSPAIANLVQSVASTLPYELNEKYPTATAVVFDLHSNDWNSLAPRHATCKAVIYGGNKLIRMPDQTPAALLAPEIK